MIDSKFYDLLSRLHANGDYRYYWNPKGGEDGAKISYWFNSDGAEVPSIWQGSDVYFSVHASDSRKSSHSRNEIEDISTVNCLFAEFDSDGDKPKLLAKIQSLSTPPSVVIDSGGGYHCYWLLDSTFSIDTDDAQNRIQIIQYAWVDFLGVADGSVKDLTRVLRVPGTVNTKYNPHRPVEFVEFHTSRTYSLDALEKLIQPQIEAIKAKQSAKSSPSAFAMNVSLDDKDLIEKMLTSNADINALWHGDMSKYQDDHSRADAALCFFLAFWCGGDADRIDRVFRQSALYRPKWDRDDYRSNTIDEAIRLNPDRYDPGHTAPDPAVQAAMSAVGTNASNAKASSSSAPQGQPQTAQSPSPDLTKIYLSQLPFDEGNAQCVFAKHGHEFIYCEAYGWMAYNGTHWEADGAESRLKRLTVEVLAERRIAAVLARDEAIVNASKPDNAKVNACISLFKSLVHKNVDIFDKDIDKINCKNGVVDLRTGFTTDHRPDDYMTYCLSVEYKPDADYVEWVEFLNDSVAHPDMIEYLQMAAGYSITGHVSEECLFYLYGPTRSGKGTFTETIIQILGSPISVEAEFNTFTAARDGDTQNFDLAPLKPSRFVVASESNIYETLNEAKVKSVTGGNYIRCAFKRRDHFEYKPQFKVWLASNHPVKGDVDDDAFWGRLRVIEFPVSKLGREDKTLKKRLLRKESLEGILAWVVDGAMAWYKEKSGLSIPDSVRSSTATQREELDYIQQWIDEECDVSKPANNNTYTIGSALYSSYEAWCKRNGVSAKKHKSFSQGLNRKGFRKVIRKVAGKTHRVFEGIVIIP